MAGRDHFSEDYLASRRRFRELASGLGAQMEALELRATGPDGKPLTIDVAWFGPRDVERVVAVSSATHGVEGFLGAAIQCQLLSDLPAIPERVAFVLIHAVNPYGFAYVRRVNEDNIDQNRNFLKEGESWTGSPEGYDAFDGMLNPRRPPSRTTHLTFPLRAIPRIVRHGLGTVKTIVAGGQYDFPKGVFFGGNGPSNTMELLSGKVPEWFGGVKHLLLVDFHSGLGKPGTYKLLVDHTSEEPRTRWLSEKFGAENVQPWDAGEGVAYEIRGGLGTWMKAMLPDAEVDVLAAEFGTTHVLNVITALVTENRAHHWGAPGDSTTKAAKARLKEAFAPADPAWRDTVVARGRRIVEQALQAI